MLVSDLSTPALLVDRPRLLANLDAMQGVADAQGVALRPHAKTHKSPDLARLQAERGARGLTVATVDEAEAFAAAGFRDLVLAAPLVGEPKLERVRRLLSDGVELVFTVDSRAGAEAAGRFFALHELVADVLVEVDTGQGRCGVDPADRASVEVVAHVARVPGLMLRGLLTHGGHIYDGPGEGETPEAALDRAAAQEQDRLLAFAARLGEAGLLAPPTTTLSIGSTPGAGRAESPTVGGFRITEMRPGTYVFRDGQQVALGAATLAQCALLAVGTVISKRRFDDGTERAILDAGKKLLTSDRGWGIETYGTVLYSPRTLVPNPHAALTALSEEHGWVDTPGASIYDVGDPIFVIPNHACVAVATRRQLHVVEGDEVVETWDLVAR